MKKIYVAQKVMFSVPVLLLTMALQFSAMANTYPFSGTYSGSQEVPANGSPGTGTITGVYDDFTNTIYYTINFNGLSTNTVAAHFHAPAVPGVNAPVIIGHAGFPTGVTAGVYSKSDILTDAQEANLFAGLMYSNIHTTALPGGEIRTQIILGAASSLIYVFNKTYSGSQEVPPNASPGTGTIKGAYNSVTNTIFYTITFSGLSTNTVAAHFHAPALPGVNAPVIIGHAGFPTGVTSGVYSKSDVLTDAQEANLLAGLVYSNIHTTALPGGEIRTQIDLQLPPVITCPSNIVVSNDAGLCGASVAFNATATGIPAPTIIYKIGATVITSPHMFPVGITTVTATASNTAGIATCSFTVRVNDTEAPVISNLGASPGMLWPPNHKMRDVTVNYTSTDNCIVVSCQLSVTSNEAVNETGDGNTSPDWVIVDNHHVKLRAERSGNGDGRVYTIRVTCTDQYGNSANSSTIVTVPHDMSSARAPGAYGTNDAGNGEGLSLSVLPNPSRNYFMLNIQTNNSAEKLNLQVIDVMGRVIEAKSNLAGNQLLRVGDKLKAGIYFVALRQGNEIKQLKLIKLD